MTSTLFSDHEVQILSKLRSRNIDVKSNFKTKHTVNNITNLQCSVKNCFKVEDQNHILQCKPVLQKLNKKLIFDIAKVKYDYIFSNVKNQKKIMEVMIPVLDMRTNLLNKQKTQE